MAVVAWLTVRRTDGRLRTPIAALDVVRFRALVKRGGANDCWDWTGRLSRGYGHFYVARSLRYAHRIAWTLTHGDPGEWCVLHRCDRPVCCNPAHLFLGTQADNIRDRDRKGRCRVGRGERHGNARFTEAEVRKIRLRHVGGWSCREMAKEYGVAPSTILRIVKRKTWKHVPPEVFGERKNFY